MDGNSPKRDIGPIPAEAAHRAEEVLDPELPIVDAHHHLWDRPGFRYLAPELREDLTGGHHVVATVYIECRSQYRADGPEAWKPVGETEFVVAATACQPPAEARIAAAIVGHVDLRLGEAAQPVLEAQIAAGKGRLRGIRQISARHADPAVRSVPFTPPEDLLSAALFREGLREAGKLGLSFDAWLYHTQLLEFYDLARAFPEMAMVLDHAGGPIGVGPYRRCRDEVRHEWTSRLRDIAALPNVYLKIGGLGMQVFGFDYAERGVPYNSEELARLWSPIVETCIDLFGAERCMFESNFPVDRQSFGYGTLWNAFKRLSRRYSPDERTALFSGTAIEVYGRSDRSSSLRQ